MSAACGLRLLYDPEDFDPVPLDEVLGLGALFQWVNPGAVRPGGGGVRGSGPPPAPTSNLSADMVEEWLLRFQRNTARARGRLASFVPPWLTSPRHVTHWRLTDQALALMPALDVGGDLPLSSADTAASAGAPSLGKSVGEHFRHVAGVLALGTRLLDMPVETRVARDGREEKTALWQRVSDQCASELDGDLSHIRTRVMRCEAALSRECVHFVWQLAAYCHDIGYHSALLSLSHRLTMTDGAPTYPTDFLAGAATRRSLVMDYARACARFTEGFERARPRYERTFLSQIRSYARDCQRRADEAFRRATGHRRVRQSRGSAPYYPWYLHAIYGAVIARNVFRALSARSGAPSCLRYIYRWIIDAIATHHMPQESGLGTWRWRFEPRPFSYLLRVVDEIPLLAVWRERPDVLPRRRPEETHWRVMLSERQNRFRLLRLSELSAEAGVRYWRGWERRNGVVRKRPDPFVVLCCPGPKEAKGASCTACPCNVQRRPGDLYVRCTEARSLDQYQHSALVDSEFDPICPVVVLPRRSRISR